MLCPFLNIVAQRYFTPAAYDLLQNWLQPPPLPLRLDAPAHPVWAMMQEMRQPLIFCAIGIVLAWALHLLLPGKELDDLFGHYDDSNAMGRLGMEDTVDLCKLLPLTDLPRNYKTKLIEHLAV